MLKDEPEEAINLLKEECANCYEYKKVEVIEVGYVESFLKV